MKTYRELLEDVGDERLNEAIKIPKLSPKQNIKDVLKTLKAGTWILMQWKNPTTYFLGEALGDRQNRIADASGKIADLKGLDEVWGFTILSK